MSVNKATLIGNVGNDPEIRNLDNDAKVANFSLATSETYKDKQGEKQTKTEWHRITVWGKLADIVEKYVTKGQQIYVEGKMRTRSYDDKDGVKKYATEIVLNGFGDTLQMLGKKAESESSNNTPPPPNEDDLPY